MKICITPYKEIKGGEKSIYDFIKNDYSVPNKVIEYLRTTKPFVMSPGIYKHPFKPEVDLLGPYMYTDVHYYWDRDTWKYVVKYGLTLPDEFVEYVTSGKGDSFLASFAKENPSWGKQIQKMKQGKNMMCFLPEDAGDIPIEKF